MRNKNNLTSLVLNRRYGNRNTIFNLGSSLLPPKPGNQGDHTISKFSLHGKSAFIPSSILKSGNGFELSSKIF